MPLGGSDPTYELWAVRRNRETGYVEEIPLSREAVYMFGLKEYEWGPSDLQIVDDAHKIVKKPRPRTITRERPDDEHEQLDDPWNLPEER